MRAITADDLRMIASAPAAESGQGRAAVGPSKLPLHKLRPVSDDDHLIRRLYSERFDFPPRPEGASRTYMIATTPRSGSTDFCIRLWRTGRFGAPMEYANLMNSAELLYRLGNGAASTYWRQLQRRRTSPNGVFGFKMFPSMFKRLEESAPALLPLITPDVVVYLRRADWLGQAVSLARAKQTGAWFAGVREAAPPRYDFRAILDAARWIGAEEAAWEHLFIVADAKPLRVTHEETLQDLQPTSDWLNGELAIDREFAASVEIPNLNRQGDGLSEEWRERFAADCRYRGVEPDAGLSDLIETFEP